MPRKSLRHDREDIKRKVKSGILIAITALSLFVRDARDDGFQELVPLLRRIYGRIKVKHAADLWELFADDLLTGKRCALFQIAKSSLCTGYFSIFGIAARNKSRRIVCTILIRLKYTGTLGLELVDVRASCIQRCVMRGIRLFL